MSRLSRIKGPRPVYILAASLTGAAAYRFLKPASSNASLHPHEFAPYILVDKQPVSSTNAIFTLQNEHDAPEPDSVKEAWKRGIWSVQVKQPQLQIARAYTPLPPSPNEAEDEDGHELRFLIRQETGGEVSTYLHQLPEGSTIELRGPNLEHELPRDVKDIIFLAGGTGIAPAMQVAQALGKIPGSKMQLLWANRRREECEGGISDESTEASATQRPSWWKIMLGLQQGVEQDSPKQTPSVARKGLIVQELELLKKSSRSVTQDLHVQYYVDEEKTFINPSDVARRIRGTETEGGGSRLIMISGPDGFVEYWAGKKLWENGQEVQGPLGGVLAKMDLKGWEVVKL